MFEDAARMVVGNQNGSTSSIQRTMQLGYNRAGRIMDQMEKHDITIGKLAAKTKDVQLNLYYTPTRLTENSLIFSKRLMVKWWQEGYDYAKQKSNENSKMSELKEG